MWEIYAYHNADALFERGGPYWYASGLNPVGLLAWAAGFITFAACGQPPWLLEHASWITNVPDWMTRIGGSIPSFAVSFLGYLLMRWLVSALFVSPLERDAVAP